MSAPPEVRTRILIVEDEALIAAELADRLRRRGFEIVGPVDTADVAVETALREQPDLVLMDVRLKGARDGIDAARELHARSTIPVMFLTANADVATYRRAQVTMPYGYVVKPFNERELVVSIDTALMRSRAENELRRDSLTFSTIASAVADAVMVLDPAEQIRYLNPAAEQLFGWRWEEVAGKRRDDVLRLFETLNDSTVVSPEHGTETMVDEPARHTGLIVGRDGTSVPVLERRTALTDALGRPLGTVCSLTDLRELQRLEQARRSSEQMSEAIFTGSPIAMAVLDTRGAIRRTNPAFRVLVGMAEQGSTAWAFDIVASDTLATFQKAVKEAPRDASRAELIEVRLRPSPNTDVLVACKVVALPHADDAHSLVLWHCLPIDAQKRLISETMRHADAQPVTPPHDLPFRHVLVVEDEPGMRHIVQRMLNRDGVVTSAVPDAMSALALLRKRSEPIDLVLTDIVMPKVSGGELARILEEEFPELPLIFMSGYHDDIFVQDAVETARRQLLYKPFTHADLSRALLQAAKRPVAG